MVKPKPAYKSNKQLTTNVQINPNFPPKNSLISSINKNKNHTKKGEPRNSQHILTKHQISFHSQPAKRNPQTFCRKLKPSTSHPNLQNRYNLSFKQLSQSLNPFKKNKKTAHPLF